MKIKSVAERKLEEALARIGTKTSTKPKLKKPKKSK